MPFAVSIEQITNFYGSKDEAVLQAILETFGDDLDRFDEQFDDDESQPTMREIAKIYFNGEAPTDTDGYKYWYFLHFLSRYFGQNLSNAHWSPASPDPLNNLGCCQSYYLPVNLPYPYDFPIVYTLQNEDLESADRSMKEQLLRKEVGDEQAKVFFSWTKTARQNNLDLMFFYF